MDVEIRPLSAELIDDYFDFFNNRAFTDNPPWGGCYCIGWQMTREENEEQVVKRAQELGGGAAGMMAALRETVVRQITSGALRGYLAYADGMSIGWCNVNDRAALPDVSATGFELPAPASGREKVVLCFEIAPGYRGMGVASALLERAASDAAREGYEVIEAFPRALAERDKWDYTGPLRLYEKAGFVQAGRRGDTLIMRRQLKA